MTAKETSEKNMGFQGFPEGKSHLISLPQVYFQQLLPLIDHLGELKLTVYVFWRLEQAEGAFRFLRQADFLQDEKFIQGLGCPLDEALQQAVKRGALLQVQLEVDGQPEVYYFLNSPKGRSCYTRHPEWAMAPAHPKRIASQPTTRG